MFAPSRSHNYTSVDTTTERFNSKVFNSEGGYNSGLDLYTNVLCACFMIHLNFVHYIPKNNYIKLKKCLFFRGETPGVNIYLALGT